MLRTFSVESLIYTRDRNVCPGSKTAGNQDNRQNFDLSLLHTQETLTNFHEDEAKKYKQNWEKKSKMADSKKPSFSKLPILNIFWQKF